MATASFRIREIDAMLNKLDKAVKKINKMSKEVPKKLEKELEFKGWSIITEWYSDYSRHFYNPTGSLLHAYKIEINEKTWGYELGPEFMDKYSHHQSNEYVYHVAFELGYHGGSASDSDDTYPGGGEPWWRYPTPLKATPEHPPFSEWYKPASKSFSPKEKIEEEFDKELEKTINNTKKELKAIVDDIKASALYRKAKG